METDVYLNDIKAIEEKNRHPKRRGKKNKEE